MHKRFLLQLIEELCDEEGIDLDVLSQGWVLRLTHSGVVKYIYGNNFDLDSAASQKIVRDKAACSEVLAFYHVPRVEHYLVNKSDLLNYGTEEGNWADIQGYAAQHGGKVVAKARDSSGGEHVYVCLNQRDLELATMALLQRDRSMVLSPFVPSSNEFRLVMLDGVCELSYAKEQVRVLGDGKSSVASLLARYVQEHPISQSAQAELYLQNRAALERVPTANEGVVLSHKHNLSKGARVRPIKAREMAALLPLAQRALQAVQLRFASVDILGSEAAGDFQVLEVNSGIMVENLIQIDSTGFDKAKALYRKVVQKMFAGRT